MKTLAEELVSVTNGYRDFGHPIDINQDLAPAYLQTASDVSRKLQLAEPIPKLCTLIVAGAYDVAIHDAYGKAHGINCFHTYGPEDILGELASERELFDTMLDDARQRNL